MKFIVFVLIYFFSLSSFLFSAEIMDCKQFDKVSAKYVECKARNLKNSLNEGQKKVKSDLSTNKDISFVKKKLLKFKNSKTLSEFIKE